MSSLIDGDIADVVVFTKDVCLCLPQSQLKAVRSHCKYDYNCPLSQFRSLQDSSPNHHSVGPNPTDPRQVLCLTWKVPLSRASGLGKLTQPIPRGFFFTVDVVCNLDQGYSPVLPPLTWSHACCCYNHHYSSPVHTGVVAVFVFVCQQMHDVFVVQTS